MLSADSFFLSRHLVATVV